jgi:hypothetical protein
MYTLSAPKKMLTCPILSVGKRGHNGDDGAAGPTHHWLMYMLMISSKRGPGRSLKQLLGPFIAASSNQQRCFPKAPGPWVLTPKIGTGKGLTCGPSLMKSVIRQENLLKWFGKDACGRRYAIIRQKDCLRLKMKLSGIRDDVARM